MKYVSLDLETTGLDVHNDQILEVGVVIDDLSWPNTIGDGDYGGRPWFRAAIKHPRITGDAFALQMNAALLLEISKGEDSVLDTENADEALRTFLRHHFKSGKIVAAGKNVSGFDSPFLRFGGFTKSHGMLHHRSCDPAMLYFEVGDVAPPSLSQCLSRAGITESVAHTACADAWQVIRLIRNKLCNKE